jgi:hypothetical protein
MAFGVKVVKNFKTLMLTVNPGQNVLVHDSNGDPSALSVIFEVVDDVVEALMAAVGPDDLARIVRDKAPDVHAYAVVPGRITLRLEMADGNEAFLHKDTDGTLNAHGADFKRIEPKSLFWNDQEKAMKELAKAKSAVDMFDVVQNVGLTHVVRVSAPKPFRDRPTAKSMDEALTLIEEMLEPPFDRTEAQAFLLEKGRTLRIRH